jgi:hypothetical protein
MRISSDNWYPRGTRPSYYPEPGQLLAYDHAVYRVIEVRVKPDDQWPEGLREQLAGRRQSVRLAYAPYNVVVRPVRVTGNDPTARNHDMHLSKPGGRMVAWDIYPNEHYPICGACLEPLPCRHEHARHVAEQQMQQLSRYEDAGVCPSCRELVTTRQKSLTFSENLEIPGGPPVTFHIGRRGCRYSAGEYEKRWVAADPERRKATLSCPGHVTNHNDGTYDCTQLAECPGPLAFHPSYSVCRCPDCHARGGFGCTPAPNAALNVRQAGL